MVVNKHQTTKTRFVSLQFVTLLLVQMRSCFPRRRDTRGEDVVVGGPLDTQHPLHVDANLLWQMVDVNSTFTLYEEIGEGSFGTVYRGKHNPTGYELAVKVVDMDEENFGSLNNEINTLKRCKHHNIVSYFGSCSQADSIWILMDNHKLGSVRDVIERRNRPLKEKEVAYICREVLKGLEYLHSQDIVHRDIKSAHILMNDNGDIRLGGFRVSQMLQASSTLGSIAGTPHWMAPEITSKYTSKVDIWSLGITAIEMAEGQPPHADQKSAQAMLLIRQNSSPTLANQTNFGQDFISFVDACLIKDPDVRPSATELLKHPFIQKAKGPQVLKKLIKKDAKQRRSRGSQNVVLDRSAEKRKKKNKNKSKEISEIINFQPNKEVK